MRIPLLGWLIDERFLEHRRRSTSVAGQACLVATAALFEYRLFARHVYSWDLLALVALFAVVKFAMFAWYRFTG
jgi:hypothetical protein